MFLVIIVTKKVNDMKWIGTSESFKEYMAWAISKGLDPKELAICFETTESTVLRWSVGVAVPLPRIQKMVVAEIKSMLGV
jgi:hypothetical protein